MILMCMLCGSGKIWKENHLINIMFAYGGYFVLALMIHDEDDLDLILLLIGSHTYLISFRYPATPNRVAGWPQPNCENY